MSADMIDIECEFQVETEDAICIRPDPDDKKSDVWLPKSQIEWEGQAERGEDIIVAVPEWLAEQEGLI